MVDPFPRSDAQLSTRRAPRPDHYICARCGVVPLVTCRVEGKLYAVVNVNTLDNIEPAMLQHRPASFSEEDATAKLSRRQSNWIGDVTIVEGVQP